MFVPGVQDWLMARSEARHFEQALRANNCVDVSHSSLIKDAVNSYPNGPQVGRMVPHPPRSMRSIDPTLLSMM